MRTQWGRTLRDGGVEPDEGHEAVEMEQLPHVVVVAVNDTRELVRARSISRPSRTLPRRSKVLLTSACLASICSVRHAWISSSECVGAASPARASPITTSALDCRPFPLADALVDAVGVLVGVVAPRGAIASGCARARPGGDFGRV